MSIGFGLNFLCVQKCPRGFYAYEARRCIREDECRAIKKPLSIYDLNLLDLPYIPHDGVCRIDCPSNFYPDGPSEQRVCTKCVSTCKKVCPPARIEVQNGIKDVHILTVHLYLVFEIRADVSLAQKSSLYLSIIESNFDHSNNMGDAEEMNDYEELIEFEDEMHNTVYIR